MAKRTDTLDPTADAECGLQPDGCTLYALRFPPEAAARIAAAAEREGRGDQLAMWVFGQVLASVALVEAAAALDTNETIN